MKILAALLPLSAAFALTACGGDDCGACAEAAADAHSEVTYADNELEIACEGITVSTQTNTCEASAGGFTINVKEVIADGLEGCGLTVPEECK